MRDYINIDRLHRDALHAKISGVCAGLAKHWDQPRWAIRIAAILSLLLLPVPTAVAYGMAVLLLPTRP
ncbi:MAG: hypothetical protein CMP20_03780 [Rickettsiales bacterium]|nr:hypothetical protein [Rickettsiales bacterium]